MTSAYDPIAASAAALIARKGARMKFTRRRVAHAPVTQQNTTTDVAFWLNAVVVPVGPTSSFRVAAGLVGKSVVKVYAALHGSPMTPEPGDLFTYAGKEMRLRDVSIINPAGDKQVLAECTAEA